MLNAVFFIYLALLCCAQHFSQQHITFTVYLQQQLSSSHCSSLKKIPFSSFLSVKTTGLGVWCAAKIQNQHKTSRKRGVLKTLQEESSVLHSANPSFIKVQREYNGDVCSEFHWSCLRREISRHTPHWL